MYDAYYNVNDVYIDILLYFLGNNAESVHMFSTDVVFWVFFRYWLNAWMQTVHYSVPLCYALNTA